MRHFAKMAGEIRFFLYQADTKWKDKERLSEDYGFIYRSPVSDLDLSDYDICPFNFEITPKYNFFRMGRAAHLYSESFSWYWASNNIKQRADNERHIM